MNDDDRRLANILGAFALAMTDRITDAMTRSIGQGPMASAALIQIGQNDGLSIETLRRFLGLSHSAAVRIVDQLEKAGFAGRVRGASTDSRVTALSLTAAGRELMDRALEAREHVALGVIGLLDGEQKAALAAAIDTTAGAIVDEGDGQDVACRLCDLGRCPQDRCPIGNAHGCKAA